MFTFDELNKVVSETLKEDVSIPEGHKGALVGIVDNNGARVVVATKINDTWKVDGIIGVSKEHGLEAGVKVKATW